MFLPIMRATLSLPAARDRSYNIDNRAADRDAPVHPIRS